MTSAATSGRLPGHVTAIAGAFLVSCMGDGLAITALMLDFHDRGVGSASITGLFTAMSLPAIVFADLAGRIADRYPARRALLPTGAALVAACFVMAFISTPVLLILLLAALSGLMAVAAPIFTKTVLDASPGPLMSRAAAQVSMATSLGFLIGPAVGAILKDAVGLRGVLLVDAATYLVVPAVALLLPTHSGAEQEHTTSQQPSSPPKSGLQHGLRILIREAPAARVVVLGTALAFTLQITNVVEVYLVRDDYQASAFMFGLVTMVWAAGQILGSGIAGRILAQRSAQPAATLTVVAVGLALATTAILNSLPALFALMLAAGAANGAFGVARQTTLGRAVEPEHRGSAVAAHSALLNTATVLALTSSGVLATMVAPRPIYAAAGALLLLLTATVYLVHRKPVPREGAVEIARVARDTTS